MCVIFTFVLAHIVAWSALGGGWRGAGRAPFVVFVPALALILLDAVLNDSYAALGVRVATLASWELLYFFLYVCLRLAVRPGPGGQALPRR
ncbi:hypothetical protein [Hyphomicrobium sp.]|uniref:hypothetical protein n=1 Tax=Hyphomicrobium sp. TaxID=82 RepID=UPI0025BE9208|nr:hypothetical protein [Hyphomicrobium sp.]MCC7251249.1 hypothetical protein [Hyphomicrobium sp.]